MISTEVLVLPIGKLKNNPDNPRDIRDEKYLNLKQSLLDAPHLLEAKPLIIDEKNIVLGGNMRLRILKELSKTDSSFSSVNCVRFTGLTHKQKQEIIIKDNLSYGETDHDLLTSHFNIEDLDYWGMSVEGFELLDDEKEDKPIFKKLSGEFNEDDYLSIKKHLKDNKLTVEEVLLNLVK